MRMPVYELEWKNPPAKDEAIVQGILAQLQAKPGSWSRICKNRSSTALAADWMKKHGCEAQAVRSNPDEKPPRYDIYVRWPANKAPTVSLAVREEAMKMRQAISDGKAHTPPPAGGYLAQRAQRGTPTNGNPL